MPQIMCTDCDGDGVVDCPYCGTPESYDCDNCEGTGYVDDEDAAEDDDDPRWPPENS